MISNWQTFNEKVSGRFTEDMAMEIVFYFSEDSKPSKEINDLFFHYLENEGITRLWDFYEAGGKEYQQAITKLFGLCQKGSLEFRDNMIDIYNRIREERKEFPTIIEIENFLITIVDSGYDFRVSPKNGEYTITLDKGETTMKEFTDTCMYLDDIIDDLQTPQCDSTIEKAERIHVFLNDGTGKAGLTHFKLIIRKRGTKKNFWTGEITPNTND